MKTRVECETLDDLQTAIKRLTNNYTPGFSYEVPFEFKNGAAYVLIVDDGRPERKHIASKECHCNPVVVEDFRDT